MPHTRLKSVKVAIYYARRRMLFTTNLGRWHITAIDTEAEGLRSTGVMAARVESERLCTRADSNSRR